MLTMDRSLRIPDLEEQVQQLEAERKAKVKERHQTRCRERSRQLNQEMSSSKKKSTPMKRPMPHDIATPEGQAKAHAVVFEGLSAMLAHNTERLVQLQEKQVAKMGKGFDTLNARVEKEEAIAKEEAEAYLMALTEIYKDMQGTRVATPGPTPVPSRSSSRSSSPAANLGCIDFGNYETPAKKAAASVILSPVYSEGSGGSSASLDAKIPAVPSNKMCLIVGKFSTGDPLTIQKIENLPSGIKSVMQIEDCTCVLLGNKKVVLVAFIEKGYLYGQKPRMNEVDNYLWDLNASIDGSIAKIVGMDGADSFGCVLAEVKPNHHENMDVLVAKMPATDPVD